MEPTESEKLIIRIKALLNSEDNPTHWDEDNTQPFKEWCNNFHITQPSFEDLEECVDCYAGEFRNAEALAIDLDEQLGITNEIPENLRFYFDYEAYGRDLILSGDYWSSEGHFFRSM